ncbi:hypothetical protein NPIL_603921 [Nephila pilipes]|uniref:Uncharacterized protein n=1 Tax=Nephila pilipes TaxID=299642 RepID=A0A8X6PJB1_NEPPI|nr:hypothetical protein NPIL_603921 [Nephila pilipes]
MISKSDENHTCKLLEERKEEKKACTVMSKVPTEAQNQCEFSSKTSYCFGVKSVVGGGVKRRAVSGIMDGWKRLELGDRPPADEEQPEIGLPRGGMASFFTAPIRRLLKKWIEVIWDEESVVSRNSRG